LQVHVHPCISGLALNTLVTLAISFWPSRTVGFMTCGLPLPALEGVPRVVYATTAFFAALAARAFARFATSAALRAGDSFRFAFFAAGAAFFAVVCAFEASAFFNSHRFFVAAIIAFLPAAESLRLGLGTASGAIG
jgi:hypothetical protein